MTIGKNFPLKQLDDYEGNSEGEMATASYWSCDHVGYS